MRSLKNFASFYSEENSRRILQISSSFKDCCWWIVSIFSSCFTRLPSLHFNLPCMATNLSDTFEINTTSTDRHLNRKRFISYTKTSKILNITSYLQASCLPRWNVFEGISRSRRGVGEKWIKRKYDCEIKCKSLVSFLSVAPPKRFE
jgi:hypothetical protein